jgi:hypothetical protein
MGDYRHIDTGEIKTQGQWRSHYKNVSLPRTWTAATLDGLKLEAVFETPKPDVSQYQNAVRNGVDRDAKGNWVWGWDIRDMFSDSTDEDGVLHTKADQESAYQARLDADASDAVRSKRDKLIADTDWMALSDNTLTAEWATYRQALRDVTNHVNFPYLTDEDWPVEPA